MAVTGYLLLLLDALVHDWCLQSIAGGVWLVLHDFKGRAEKGGAMVNQARRSLGLFALAIWIGTTKKPPNYTVRSTSDQSPPSWKRLWKRCLFVTILTSPSKYKGRRIAVSNRRWQQTVFWTAFIPQV